MTTNYLHNLTTKELLSILRHVQQGHDYLSKKLSKKDYKYLLSIGSLSNSQVDKLKNDNQEKIGNVSVVVNTILTSCFGAWLGFNAFTESTIISWVGLIIIFAGMSFGILTGYLSYLMTHRQAKLALVNQQICNVSRLIIEIIINKRQSKIDRMRKKTCTLLQNIDFENYKNQDDSEQKLLDSLRNFLSKQLKDPHQVLFNRSLANLNRSIKKLEIKKFTTPLHEKEDYNTADFLINNSLTSAAYIKILTKTDLPKKNQIPKVNTWLRKNILGVLVGLLPTLLGSFASMFVFLNGIPAFLTGIGVDLGLSKTTVLFLKNCSLILAVSISVYFAYSHIHSNYKAFRRAQLLDHSENELTEKTTIMINLMSQLNHWTKIYYHLQLVDELKNYLQHIKFPTDKDQSLDSSSLIMQ